MGLLEADLVVAGAGFAGLACAAAAASRGVRTVVLERRSSPGHSPNTTGLLVKEVADLWDVPRRLTRKIHGVRLYGPSMQYVDLDRPGYYFLATDTSAVLQWWANQAESAGAVVRSGCAFRDGASDAHGVHLSVRGKAGDEAMQARYLVGADGVSSLVAERFGLGRNRRWLPGLEAEFQGVTDLEDDRLHVFVDSALAPGYIAWMVPGVGVTQVGLAAHRHHPLNVNAIVERAKTIANFDKAKVVGYRAGKIPVGGPVRPIGRARVLLVGDAAGLVSPLTAGGIHTAIDLGRQAGLAVSDHLLDGGCDPHAVMRRHLPHFWWKRGLRSAYDAFPPPNWMIDAAIKSRPVRVLMQMIFFHHRGLFSAEAWKDAFTRLALGAG